MLPLLLVNVDHKIHPVLPYFVLPVLNEFRLTTIRRMLVSL